jgi:hypothetical protein
MNNKHTEHGQIIFLFAASFAAVMALVMLALDFGGAAMTWHRAQIAADAAAFAGAQAVDIQHFYRTQEVRLEGGAAARLVGQYASLNARGDFRLTGIYVSEDRVWVTAEMRYRSIFAGYIGMPVLTARITSSAAPAYGIRERCDAFPDCEE